MNPPVVSEKQMDSGQWIMNRENGHDRLMLRSSLSLIHYALSIGLDRLPVRPRQAMIGERTLNLTTEKITWQTIRAN
jgi:hypothetical protein